MTDSKMENSRIPEKKKKPGKPKGSPKTGGRKKGTPNRNSTNLIRGLDEKGFDFLGEYLAIFHSLSDDAKLSELKFLLKYVYPMLKEREVTTEPPADDTPALEDNEAANLSDDKLVHLLKNNPAK